MRFYDSHRSPIICPGCGAEFAPENLIKVQKSCRAPQAEIMVEEAVIGLDTGANEDTSIDLVFDEDDVDVEDKEGPGVIEDNISDIDELLRNLEENDD